MEAIKFFLFSFKSSGLTYAFVDSVVSSRWLFAEALCMSSLPFEEIFLKGVAGIGSGR